MARTPRLALVGALMCLVLAGGCSRYGAVAPGRIGIGPLYSVSPEKPWNRRDSGGLEYWTVDGPLLHQLILIPGREKGQSLFPVGGANRARKRRRRPRFDPAMTAPEIAEFFEASLIQAGAVVYHLRRAGPARFGPAAGFRFEFNYAISDGIERSGFAVGTIHRDRLLMVIHVGARHHYAAAYRERVERLIAGIELTTPP